MIKRRRFPKVFFGWWTVLASGIVALWGHGFHTHGFSALFKPIALELGFSRAVTSAAASIRSFQSGFEAPLIGWITDRFGPRWIVLSGILLISLSLILMDLVDSLWAYYVVWGVMLGTGANMVLMLPMDVAIANWFVKKRGLALSIKWVFSGLSGVLVLPLIAWLITIQGWQTTCVIGGVVMALVGLPLAWFFLKQHRPEYYGLLPDGATAEEEAVEVSQMIDRGVEYAAEIEEVEFTLRQALRTRAYWLILISVKGKFWANGGPVALNIPLSDIREVRSASGSKAFSHWSLRFATSSRHMVEMVRKKGLSLLISPANADMFLE